jgi:hypothetical protein
MEDGLCRAWPTASKGSELPLILNSNLVLRICFVATAAILLLAFVAMFLDAPLLCLLMPRRNAQQAYQRQHLNAICELIELKIALIAHVLRMARVKHHWIRHVGAYPLWRCKVGIEEFVGRLIAVHEIGTAVCTITGSSPEIVRNRSTRAEALTRT